MLTPMPTPPQGLLPKRVLIITFELKGAGPYTALFDAIKALGAWWHYLPSTWIVATQQTPEQVWQAMRLHMQDKSDHIFIGTLQSGFHGWLPNDAWEWLKQQGLAP